jgi:hypothetical protein
MGLIIPCLLLLAAICPWSWPVASASDSADTLWETQRILTGHEKHLLMTAVVSHPEPPHHAYLICMKSPPSHVYPTVGYATFLSGATNVTLVTLPPSSEEGWHRPPAPMWFVLLRGRARVECPWRNEEVIIQPDLVPLRESGVAVEAERQQHIEPQIVLALDVLGKGHLTYYDGEEETLALQVPLEDGWHWADKGWSKLHDGSCQ